MKVLPTQSDVAVAQTTDSRTDEATTASFKSALAQASTTGGTAAGTDVTTTTTDEAVPAGVKLRKGEAVKQVEGHAYAEVTSGAREGMFINTSGNVRNGQAFVLVRKHGKEYHIYGTGKDRLVVGFHMPSTKPADDTSSTTTKPTSSDLSDIKLRKGEKLEPVEGHPYAEIVSGARSGMYINTSSNSRRGEAFVLVEKSDFDYHIYGTGADRVVIRAAKRDDEAK
jgi:acid phosphatase family membrane protein YuiD